MAFTLILLPIVITRGGSCWTDERSLNGSCNSSSSRPEERRYPWGSSQLCCPLHYKRHASAQRDGICARSSTHMLGTSRKDTLSPRINVATYQCRIKLRNGSRIVSNRHEFQNISNIYRSIRCTRASTASSSQSRYLRLTIPNEAWLEEVDCKLLKLSSVMHLLFVLWIYFYKNFEVS